MTGFIESNLITGEKLVYKSEVHWMVYFPAAVNFAFALFTFIFGRYILNIQTPIVPVLTMILFVVGTYKAVASYIHRHFTEIAITDSRLIAKFGFIRREMIELPLVKIESVIVEQSIPERVINAGSVAVRGTGMAMAPIRYIDEPIRFRNELNQAIANAKNNN